MLYFHYFCERCCIIMQNTEILDVKQFMQLLFQTSSFDFYEMVSATLRTDMDYQIDGRWNHDFFDENEIDTHKLSDYTYLPWSLAKDKIFALIKGKKTPTVMKLIFKMSTGNLESLLHAINSSQNINDIDGVHLNITFQNQKLNVTCSVSYKIFNLDKSLEQEIFNDFVTLLKSNNVTSQ